LQRFNVEVHGKTKMCFLKTDNNARETDGKTNLLEAVMEIDGGSFQPSPEGAEN